MEIVINKFIEVHVCPFNHDTIMLYAKKSNLKLYPYCRVLYFNKKTSMTDYKLVPYDEYNNRKRKGKLTACCPIVYYRDELCKNKDDYEDNYSVRFFPEYHIQRDDKNLIKAIKEIGIEYASEKWSILKIIDIPDNIEWCIEQSKGSEYVQTGRKYE